MFFHFSQINSVNKSFCRLFSTLRHDRLGPNSRVLSDINRLNNWSSHIMQKQQPESKLKNCPHLSDFPELLNSAAHESNARGYVRKFPIVIEKAEGCKLTTTDGRQFYDCLNVAGTLALGHNHPVIVNTIKEFLETGQPLQVLDLSTPVKDKFLTELLSVLPKELNKVHFCSPAGTDALDAAVKLCKIATGRNAVASFHGAYHGMGQAPLALMGNLSAKVLVGSLMPDVHFLPFPYQYRPPFGIFGEAGEKAVMTYIETLLNDVESGIPKPAAVVLEAIQGEGGVNEISDFSLRELRRITKDANIPLIIDEVQAGFCRSGDFFAFQRSGIVPDVIMMSKALGGSMPMACIAFTEELNQWSPAAHTGTFRGNQLAFACGSASIQFMKQEKLWEQAKEKGDYIKKEITKVQERSNGRIGDIRGRGLMMGIECVNPNETDHIGVPIPDGNAAERIQLECFKRGLILERGGRNGCVLRLLPYLAMSSDDLQASVSILSDAFDAVFA